jgi:membrane protease YdiL (CAAX protease family)
MAMQIPGTPSLLFLFYLLFLLPWMAFKSHRTVSSRPGNVVAFSDSELERIWYGTILNLSMMFALAWAVGDGFDFEIFRLPAMNFRIVLAATSALAICFLIRAVARRTQTADERQRLVVFALAPRTRRQWLLKAIVVICASIAEESAYRGVGWAILSYSTSNRWLAALVCCVAFALGHWLQGWKSMLIIFLFAVIMHGLVWSTESLVPAMIIHGAYDLIAISLIANEASHQRQCRTATDTGETDHV